MLPYHGLRVSSGGLCVPDAQRHGDTGAHTPPAAGAIHRPILPRTHGGHGYRLPAGLTDVSFYYRSRAAFSTAGCLSLFTTLFSFHLLFLRLTAGGITYKTAWSVPRRTYLSLPATLLLLHRFTKILKGETHHVYTSLHCILPPFRPCLTSRDRRRACQPFLAPCGLAGISLLHPTPHHHTSMCHF